MTTPRHISTDPDPSAFDDDEADTDLVHATKRRSRRSDLGLDADEDDLTVNDEAERRDFEDPSDTEPRDPDERRDVAPASAGLDPAKRGCTCLWCGSMFERRRDGGRAQKYCSEPCRRSFAKAALARTEEAIASGALAREQLRKASPATPRSFLEGGRETE